MIDAFTFPTASLPMFWGMAQLCACSATPPLASWPCPPTASASVGKNTTLSMALAWKFVETGTRLDGTSAMMEILLMAMAAHLFVQSKWVIDVKTAAALLLPPASTWAYLST